jgi:sugar-specific transcriptional regulator TrmB
MEKIINILRKLGLNRYESKAYLALVSSGISTAGRLAEKSGIPRAKVYEVLRGLEKQGFAVSTSTRPSKFKPVKLDDMIMRLQDRAKQDYDSRLGQITDIHKELEKNLKDVEVEKGSEEEMVWILRGRDNIYNAIDKLVDGSKNKLLAATTEKGVVRKLFRHKEKLSKAARRGVDVRVLAPITKSNAEIVRDAVEDFILQHGNSVSARFVLSDDRRGVIILHGDEEGVAQHTEMGLLINSPYFIRALGHFFEHKWAKTTPLDERLGELKIKPNN